MKVLCLEEKFINLLTYVVWYFSIKWNKGTLFVFFFFSFIFPSLCGFLLQVQVFLEITNKSVLDYLLVLVIAPSLLGATLTISLFAPIVFHWVDKRINVLQQLNKTPNPNRYNGWLWKARLMIFVYALVFMYTFVAKDYQGSFLIKVASSAFTISITLICCYILCVDQIPPAEKKKWLERKEVTNKNLSLSPTT